MVNGADKQSTAASIGTMTVGAGMMTVTRSEPVLVHPAQPVTAGEFYPLTIVDHKFVEIIKTLHLYMATEGGGGTDRVAAVIKAALEKVLVHYYPFDGSLTAGSDGKLMVRNDRHGVPFVEATADCELAELGNISLPDASKLGQFVYEDPGWKNVIEWPLLTVQVTRFKCGGFVLGLAMHHAVIDGLAAVDFMHSWAETARGLPLSLPPFLDHTVLRPRQPPLVQFPHHDSTEVDDVSGLAEVFNQEPFEYRVFSFDAKKMARLKQLATGMSSAVTRSSYVTLTAFLWQARTRVLKMKPEQMTKLFITMDIRHRVNPPLPAGFWGNAVVLACCLRTAGDLLAAPLSDVAQSVEEAIKGTTNAFVRSAIDHDELTRGPVSLMAALMVTAWNWLEFQSSDFGWGEAVQWGSIDLPQKEMATLLAHSTDSKGAAALLGLPAPAIQHFQDIVDGI